MIMMTGGDNYNATKYCNITYLYIVCTLHQNNDNKM